MAQSRGFTLEIRGSAEYGARARKQGESWPHLLVEQDAVRLLPLDELDEIRLRIRVRLLHSKSGMPAAEYDPGLHAAQFQMFFIVRTSGRSPRIGAITSGSACPSMTAGMTSRPLSWPPMPARKMPPANSSTPLPARHWAKHHSKQVKWVALDVNLLPHILHGSSRSRQERVSQRRSDPHDYAVANMNLGWEIPGTFDAAVQVQDLEVSAIERDTTDEAITPVLLDKKPPQGQAGRIQQPAHRSPERSPRDRQPDPRPRGCGSL